MDVSLKGGAILSELQSPIAKTESSFGQVQSFRPDESLSAYYILLQDRVKINLHNDNRRAGLVEGLLSLESSKTIARLRSEVCTRQNCVRSKEMKSKRDMEV